MLCQLLGPATDVMLTGERYQCRKYGDEAAKHDIARNHVSFFGTASIELWKRIPWNPYSLSITLILE